MNLMLLRVTRSILQIVNFQQSISLLLLSFLLLLHLENNIVKSGIGDDQAF
jgi:hypothetical protein